MASSLSEIRDRDFLVTFQEVYINCSGKERERVILNALQPKVLLQLVRTRDEHGTAKFHEQ